jgi:hypothetical protein
MTTATTLDLTADVIDVRDIIARYEELAADMPEGTDAAMYEWLDANPKLRQLSDILAELAGYGGDEQWRGDWYPVTLIDDAYFVDYVQDMLADCGEVPRDLPEYIEIDWRATARNVQTDYSSVEIDGRTYWYR